MADEREEKQHHSAMPYVIVFVALLAATVVTYLLSEVRIGAAQIPVALAIAGTKGFLVAWWFMHLNEQRGVNRIFFLVAMLFVVILIAGMMGDVETRGEDVQTMPPAMRDQPEDI